MEETQKVITYYYQKKNGEIEVNYLEYGTNKVLAEKVSSTQQIGTSYTTKDKIDEINENNDNAYELISVVGPTTGEYKLEKQVITYYYAKKSSKVVTRYVDIDTNEEIYDFNVEEGTVGQKYTTVNQLENINKKYGDIYEFVRVDGNTKGNLQEETIIVTYYYQKYLGKVEVNYVDIDTNKTLAEKVKFTGKIGTEYTTEDKIDEINDNQKYFYEFVKVDGNKKGNYLKEKQVITYYYKKVKSKIVVKFLSEDTQEEISEREEYEDYIGKEYSTRPKDIEGWKLVESKIPYNKSGNYQKDIIEVVYYYSKINSSNNNEENTSDNVETSDINITLITGILIVAMYGIIKLRKNLKHN